MNLAGRLYYCGARLKGTEWLRYVDEIRTSVQDRSWPQYLSKTIHHAVWNVPYYAALGLSPDANLSDFPILSRRQLRQQFVELQSRGVETGRLPKVCTGGSTGEPVWVIQDRTSRQWERAADMYYFDALLGMPIRHYLSHRRLFVWHRRRQRRRWLSPINWVARALKQVEFLEPYTVTSEEAMLHRLERINRFRPAVIWAFASSLHELAKLARRRRIRMHRPLMIISSVEMLYPPMRETIEEVFRCPVRDYYGAVEAGRVAAQCTHGRFHIFATNSHVEVLSDDGRPVGPGEEGRLIITALHNRAMPLLRYDIGDMARQGTGECSCGNPLPVLESITGRVIEHFVTPNDSIVYGGYFVAMFYEQDWVSEFQVLQQDVDRVAIFYVKMPGQVVPSGAFERLDGTIRGVLGPSCRIEWQEVDAIPRTPVGKHLHTRSLVWEERQHREE